MKRALPLHLSETLSEIQVENPCLEDHMQAALVVCSRELCQAPGI